MDENQRKRMRNKINLLIMDKLRKTSMQNFSAILNAPNEEYSYYTEISNYIYSTLYDEKSNLDFEIEQDFDKFSGDDIEIGYPIKKSYTEKKNNNNEKISLKRLLSQQLDKYINTIHYEMSIYNQNHKSYEENEKDFTIFKRKRSLSSSKEDTFINHFTNESAKYLDKYDFANISIQKDGKYCCSTTLLYDYLKSKEAIQSSQAIDSFCEATRLYDIGQWKLDSLNQTPRNLSLLYEIFGPIKYIDVMLEKLQKHNTFFFSDSENTAICNKKKLIHQKVTSYIANMRIKNINGYRTGILFIAYEYRNEIAQCLRKNNTMRLDQVILVALDNRSISFRNINPDINVRPLAEALGGKGHYGAAGCYITKNNIDKVTQLVL